LSFLRFVCSLSRPVSSEKWKSERLWLHMTLARGSGGAARSCLSESTSSKRPNFSVCQWRFLNTPASTEGSTDRTAVVGHTRFHKQAGNPLRVTGFKAGRAQAQRLTKTLIVRDICTFASAGLPPLEESLYPTENFGMCQTVKLDETNGQQTGKEIWQLALDVRAAWDKYFMILAIIMERGRSLQLARALKRAQSDVEGAEERLFRLMDQAVASTN